MNLDFIVMLVMSLGVYIVVGMIVSLVVNFNDYLIGDYFFLITIAYPIIIPILTYVELKRFLKEIKKM